MTKWIVAVTVAVALGLGVAKVTEDLGSDLADRQIARVERAIQ